MSIDTSNFREIAGGKISPKLLYRSSHPIYDGKQDEDIILAASAARIKTIINLSDNIRSLEQKIMHCPWYKRMFEENNVLALNISMGFAIADKKFTQKIRDGLLFMIEHEPPYLLHCEAGIDRTGFLAIILESFMGASFDDIVKDYMLSFVDESEYSLNDHKNGAEFVTDLFGKIKGEAAQGNENLQCLSEKYLLEKIKLSGDEAQLLANRLMADPSSPSAQDA